MIIVEDGSIVDGANSYVTTAELVTYADERGVDYSALTTAELEVLLIKAMDYLEAKRDQFKGLKRTKEQSLQWPRYDVMIDGWYLNEDEIPRELQYAQLALAIEANSADLQPTQLANVEQGALIRKRIEGVIEKEWSNPTSPRSIPAFAKADALIGPLLKNSGLTLIRK